MNLESKFYELSELLYKNDPAGTCCVENGANDEYDFEAIAILGKKEISIDCIFELFDKNFGEYDRDVIIKILPNIAEIYYS